MISQPVRPNLELPGDSDATAGEFMGEIYGIDEGWSTRSFDACSRFGLARGRWQKAGSESRAPILPGQGAENFASVFVVFVRVENAAQKLAYVMQRISPLRMKLLNGPQP